MQAGGQPGQRALPETGSRRALAMFGRQTIAANSSAASGDGMTCKRVRRWAIAAGIVVLLAFAAIYGVWQMSRARDFQLFGRIVPRVETTEKVVALTFDDGPTADYAPGVLAVLK